MKTIVIENEITKETISSVRKQLSGTWGDLEVIISSLGGSVVAGISIDSMLNDYRRKNHGVRMIAKIQGLAASMASFIVCCPAFDSVMVEDSSIFLVHNPFMGIQGDARELRKSADYLDKMTNTLANQYARKTGKSMDKIRKMMDDESWFFGQEIVQNGFADTLIETGRKVDRAVAMATAKQRFNGIAGQIKLEAAAVIRDMSENTVSLQSGFNAEMNYRSEVDRMCASRGLDPVYGGDSLPDMGAGEITDELSYQRELARIRERRSGGVNHA